MRQIRELAKAASVLPTDTAAMRDGSFDSMFDKWIKMNARKRDLSDTRGRDVYGSDDDSGSPQVQMTKSIEEYSVNWLNFLGLGIRFRLYYNRFI